MVKKLFKHELASYLHVLIPTYLLLMIFAIGYRVIQIFDSEALAYTTILTVTRVVYALSILAMVALSAYLPIVRFYRNLFTCEGYLTFTLPVSPTNHIWVKLACAILVNIMTLAAAALTGLIVSSGAFFREAVKAVVYLINGIPTEYAGHSVLLTIEFLVILLVGSVSMYLMYYLCIAIGQLSKKNRILAAVGTYFAFTMLGQIIGTVFTIIMNTTGAPLLDALFTLLEGSHPVVSIHIIPCGIILIELIIGAVFFLITRHIMTKKLNLE